MEEQGKSKYFTPDIEDIRVGYKCQREVPDYSKEFCYPSELHEAYCLGDKFDWEDYTLTAEDIIQVHLFPPKGDLRRDKGHPILGWYRTPYLTKEQIEAEGWTPHKLDYLCKKVFTKGNFEINLVNTNTGQEMWIQKWTGKESERTMSRIYAGICKDINTLRYISKLLKIN